MPIFFFFNRGEVGVFYKEQRLINFEVPNVYPEL